MILPGLRTGLIAGGLWLAGVLALAVKGTTNGGVREEMRARIELARGITRLMADAKNAEAVAAEKGGQAELARELTELHALLERINRRDPVLGGVFPEGGPAHRRVRFVELYRDTIEEFSRQLRGGGLPTPAEIERARQDLEEAARWRNEGAQAKEVRVMGKLQRGGAGVDDQGLKYASAAKAQRIRCFVDAEAFEVPALVGRSTAPSADELWFAQIELWIQQDVVAAIAALNAEAANTQGSGACVEQMPVKRIRAVWLLGYQLRGGLLFCPMREGSCCQLCAGVPVSLTGQACSRDFDVVVFQVAVVMDQRDVLQLIDQIGKRNLYQCTAAVCEAVPTGDAAAGYLYGTEPAVCVGLEFEAYMLRSIYGPLVPPSVRRMLEFD
jgi:hypothetical protein